MNPLESLYQALGSQPYDPAEAQAHQQLAQQGSVMAKAPTPFQGHPVLGPLTQVLSQALDFANPINWMGGAPGAVEALPVPGGPMFHGTSHAFEELSPQFSKSSGLVGPGVGYFTDNPLHVASDYAMGATQGVAPMAPEELTALLKAKPPGDYYSQLDLPRDYAPNIRPYQMAPHESFVTQEAFPQKDMDRLMQALRQAEPPPSTRGGFFKGNPAKRMENVARQVQGLTGESGKAVYDTLVNNLGPERANQIIKDAGFKSISYEGGQLMGGTPHRAVNVLDSSILQNLFDFLVGRAGTVK